MKLRPDVVQTIGRCDNSAQRSSRKSLKQYLFINVCINQNYIVNFTSRSIFNTFRLLGQYAARDKSVEVLGDCDPRSKFRQRSANLFTTCKAVQASLFPDVNPDVHSVFLCFRIVRNSLIHFHQTWVRYLHEVLGMI